MDEDKYNLHLDEETAGKYNEHFDATAACYDLFEEIIRSLMRKELRAGDMSTYRLIMLFNLIKATNSLRSLVLICSRRLTGDGMTIVRKLIDLALNMLFMSKDPERHAELYWHHAYVRIHYRASRYVDNAYASTLLREGFKQMFPDIEAAFEDAKKVIPCNKKGEIEHNFRRYWSGLSLLGLARECNLLHLYDRYDQFSSTVHPSAEDLTAYYDPKKLEFNLGNDKEDVPGLLCLGSELHLILSTLTAKAFDLDLKDRIESLLNRVNGLDSDAGDWLPAIVRG